MFPLERRQRIIDLLKEKKVLKHAELTEELGISIDTLRRDLNILSENREIEKIYGGIKLVEADTGESAMADRMVSHLEEKESIARLCNEQIREGDCIYIDSGSTTYQLAKAIKNRKNLTVVTNSLPVITELINSEVELIIIGGKIRRHESSVVAYDYIFNFDELNILKAFICASGITTERGISDYNLEEAVTRKKIIELSKEVYVAADHTKFGKEVTVRIAPLEKIDYIVTDQHVSPHWIEEFISCNTKLLVSE
ncbi:DeoR/GlpR transcriptional regulator [Bacillus sp. CH30_1T]|uniref:DeoR/GlpR family DNA-binding transcription regulator n=1 Tax=Bacillus sp. CH30_1T TaxID=2604836 RepID=UPI0011ECBB0B|nr:DeoR/GlpR family DNA-binding transcription regulator [Bacillus sp. CH30_1T]KAA0566647.1 DeoR/GlpR transcriptional regulator [Bacillus sp. CH30_1T]